MAFIIGILATGALLFAGHKYLTRSEHRREFNAEVRKSPGDFIGTAIGVVLFIGFFFGVLIPPFGSMRLSIGRYTLDLWQVSAIAGLFWLGIVFVVNSRRQ